MLFELFLAMRYLRAKRKQTFISVITLISVLGVMVGVMALIVVLAVMTGFTDEFREKILGINSHIVVQKIGDHIRNYRKLEPLVKSADGVSGVTPYLYTQAMITGGVGGTGAILRGIDPDSASAVLSLERDLLYGSLAELSLPEDTQRVDCRGQGLLGCESIHVETGNPECRPLGCLLPHLQNRPPPVGLVTGDCGSAVERSEPGRAAEDF